MNHLLGFGEIGVLALGAALVYLTGKWSPLPLELRFQIALLACITVLFCIPLGLTEVKPYGILYGDGKAAVFYSWALGLWGGLVLVRTQSRLRWAGCAFITLFGLLLSYIIYYEATFS